MAIDKVYITYKSNYMDFEIIQKKKTSSGNRKFKAFVNNKKWQKNTEFDKALGEMWIKKKNAKKLIIRINEIGFQMVVRRGNFFFRVNINLKSSEWETRGLCNYVPNSIDNLITHEYSVYSSPTEVSGQIGTHVSKTVKNVNSFILS